MKFLGKIHKSERLQGRGKRSVLRAVFVLALFVIALSFPQVKANAAAPVVFQSFNHPSGFRLTVSDTSGEVYCSSEVKIANLADTAQVRCVWTGPNGNTWVTSNLVKGGVSIINNNRYTGYSFQNNDAVPGSHFNYAPGTYTASLQYKVGTGQWVGLVSLNATRPAPAVYLASSIGSSSGFRLTVSDISGEVYCSNRVYIANLADTAQVRCVWTGPNGNTWVTSNLVKGGVSLINNNRYTYCSFQNNDDVPGSHFNYAPGTYTASIQYKVGTGQWVGLVSLSATRPAPAVHTNSSYNLRVTLNSDYDVYCSNRVYIANLADTAQVRCVWTGPNGNTWVTSNLVKGGVSLVDNKYYTPCSFQNNDIFPGSHFNYAPGTYTATLQYRNGSDTWKNITSASTVQPVSAAYVGTNAAYKFSVNINSEGDIYCSEVYIKDIAKNVDVRCIWTAPNGSTWTTSILERLNSPYYIDSKSYYRYKLKSGENSPCAHFNYAVGTYTAKIQYKNRVGQWVNLTSASAARPAPCLAPGETLTLQTNNDIITVNNPYAICVGHTQQVRYLWRNPEGAEVAVSATRGSYKSMSPYSAYTFTTNAADNPPAALGVKDGVWYVELQAKTGDTWTVLAAGYAAKNGFLYKATESGTNIVLNMAVSGFYSHSHSGSYYLNSVCKNAYIIVYTAKNGKDDAKRYEMTTVTDTLYDYDSMDFETGSSYTDYDEARPAIMQAVINKADHNNENGEYVIELHVYGTHAKDSSGVTKIDNITGTASYYSGLTTNTEQQILPNLVYTGNYKKEDIANGDGTYKRRYYLLSSGILTVDRTTASAITVVGGGGGGGAGSRGYNTSTGDYEDSTGSVSAAESGGGGGAGLVKKSIISLSANTKYPVVVGSGGVGTTQVSERYGLHNTYHDSYHGSERYADQKTFGKGTHGQATAFGTLVAPGGMFGVSGGLSNALGGWSTAPGTNGSAGVKSGGAGGKPGVYGNYGNGGNGGAGGQTTDKAGANGQPGVVILEFDLHSYTVKFDGNGSTSGTTANQTMVVGEAKALNANGYVKKGKVTLVKNNGTSDQVVQTNFPFTGWSKTATGAVAYTDKQSVKDLSTTNKAVVTLYAKWGNPQAVTLPTPTKTNYDFKGWYSNPECTVFVGNGGASYTPKTADDKLYAKWQIQQRTITVTETAHGTVDPMSITVDHGTSASFTVTCQEGYEVDRIVINGVTRTDLGAGPTYTIPSVVATGTMQVYYKLKTFALTVNVTGHGTVTPGSRTVSYGETINFTITPEPQYKVLSVKWNGEEKGEVTSFTTPQITAACTLDVVFIPQTDLGILSIVPGEIRAGVPMFFSVKAKNTGIALTGVPITLTIGSEVLESSFNVSEDSEAYAWFDWTPTEAGTFDCTVTVNPTSSIPEENYTNNTITTTITVLPSHDTADPDGDPDRLTTPDLPSGDDQEFLEWDENGTTYWARLNFSAEITEPSVDPMRSGYGFSVRATSNVTHNYYNEERVTDPEGVIMLLPEYDYESGIRLEQMPDGTWQLPVNPNSPTGARRWYIPTNYVDGEVYKVMFRCYGAFTPAGELRKSDLAEREIHGSMYDDDYTIGR